MDRLEEFGERVVKFGGRELVFDLWTTSTHGIYAGYVLISDYKAEKEKELRLRTQMLKKRQHAKYTVYNIKGESEAIERCRKTAMKFGALQSQRAHNRGLRNRQGAVRQRHPQRFRTQGRTVCAHQLWGSGGIAAGERAVRIRERRLYRGKEGGQTGTV